MRHRIVVATALLTALSLPARAQGVLGTGAGVPRARSDFPTFAAPISPPSAVKWGLVIGGVTGAVVGGFLVLGHPCRDGWECTLRPAAAILGIGIGAGVGSLVGGTVGNAIARDSELDAGDAAGAIVFGVVALAW